MAFTLYPGDDAFLPEAPSTDTLRPLTAQQALVNAALGLVDTSKVRRALLGPVPQLILVRTATAQWARALAQLVDKSYEHTTGHAFIELKKDGNQSAAKDLLARLNRGRHVVICSHEPDSLVPALMLGAADLRLVLRKADLALVRRAIQLFTGMRPRRLQASDIQGLDFDALALALRDASTAGQCVRRLRRASALQSSPFMPDGPGIEDLALPPAVARWALGMLAAMRAVDRGEMRAADLRFAILAGPPGTGKTMVVKALARSAGWRLVSSSVGDWFASSDGHLGGVTRACAQFMDDVLSQERTLGFIDEIEALPDRATLDSKDREWWTPVITFVLMQVDRARNSDKPVLLLGATNYHERLDKALTRDGRLSDRVPVLPLETPGEVAALLERLLGGELDAQAIAAAARFGKGMTAAEISGRANSALARARDEGRPVADRDLLDAFAPPDTRTAEDIYAVAVHEAGHAVVAHALGVAVQSVSIISEGLTGGAIQMAPPPTLPNRHDLEDLVTITLGGRAADLVVGTRGAHAGAEMDLRMASVLLSRAIGQYGLFDSLVHAGGDPLGTDRVSEEVDAGLKRLLNRAVAIVSERRAAVGRLVVELIRHRLLEGAAILPIIEGSPTVAPAVQAAVAARMSQERASRRSAPPAGGTPARADAPSLPAKRKGKATLRGQGENHRD